MSSDPYFFLRVLVTYFVSFENQFIPLSKNIISKLHFSTIKCNLHIYTYIWCQAQILRICFLIIHFTLLRKHDSFIVLFVLVSNNNGEGRKL